LAEALSYYNNVKKIVNLPNLLKLKRRTVKIIMENDTTRFETKKYIEHKLRAIIK